MPRTPATARRPLPLRRKLAFAVILVVVVPLLLLLVAELVVRWIDPDAVHDPFIAMSAPLSILSEVEVDGQRYYEIANEEVYRAHQARFPVEKPADTLRVFCFGGSAAAGFPHPPAESYPEYLRAMLAAAAPDRTIEVHNVAGHGYASYRVRLIFDALIGCDPDLVIVYSGNNEFLEERSYWGDAAVGRLVRGVASQSRLVQLLQHAMQRRTPGQALPGEGKASLETHVWLHIRQLSSELRSSPQQFADLTAHFEFSMAHIAAQAEARGVPVLLVTVPSNLRDWHPHASMAIPPTADRAQWQARAAAGRRALLLGEVDRAVAELRRAVALAGDHADTRFQLARALDALGRHADARVEYRAAKDCDGNPFRALTVFNNALRRVAAAHAGAALVDVERAFERAAADGIPGFDLFLDYVHPTKAGNTLLARVVADWILARGLGGMAPMPAAERGAVLAQYRGSDYTDKADAGMQFTLLGLFMMMHQYEAYLAVAGELIARRDAGELAPDALDFRLIEVLRDHFRAHLDNARKELLGEPFDPDYRAVHDSIYEQLLPATARAREARDGSGTK